MRLLVQNAIVTISDVKTLNNYILFKLLIFVTGSQEIKY